MLFTFCFINLIKKKHLQIELQPMHIICEKMGDVKTQINNGKD